MSAACLYCCDTGSLSKTLEGDLDCARCDVASERVNFEAWTAHAQLLGGGVIDAWKLYQMGKAAALEQAAKAVEAEIGIYHETDSDALRTAANEIRGLK